MPVTDLSETVVMNGVDVSAHLRSSQRKASLCHPGQTVELTFRATFPFASFQTWQTLTVSEMGTLVLTGFVESVSAQRAPQEVVVTGRDTYKRCLDYFITDDQLMTNGETVAYWIGYLCGVAGISYTIVASGGSQPVGVGVPLGLRSVAEALTTIIAYPGWQMRVNPSGVLEFLDLDVKIEQIKALLGSLSLEAATAQVLGNPDSVPPDPTAMRYFNVSNIFSGSRTTGDETTRTVAKIWGGLDPLTGNMITYQATRPVAGITPERIVVVANPNITSGSQAALVAGNVLDQFAALEQTAELDIAGNALIRVGDMARCAAFTAMGDYVYIDTVTELAAALDRGGYNMDARIAFRCPKLTGGLGVSGSPGGGFPIITYPICSGPNNGTESGFSVWTASNGRVAVRALTGAQYATFPASMAGTKYLRTNTSWDIMCVSAVYSNPQVAYIWADGAIRVTTDGGENWASLVTLNENSAVGPSGAFSPFYIVACPKWFGSHRFFYLNRTAPDPEDRPHWYFYNAGVSTEITPADGPDGSLPFIQGICKTNLFGNQASDLGRYPGAHPCVFIAVEYEKADSTQHRGAVYAIHLVTGQIFPCWLGQTLTHGDSLCFVTGSDKFIPSSFGPMVAWLGGNVDPESYDDLLYAHTHSTGVWNKSILAAFGVSLDQGVRLPDIRSETSTPCPPTGTTERWLRDGAISVSVADKLIMMRNHPGTGKAHRTTDAWGTFSDVTMPTPITGNVFWLEVVANTYVAGDAGVGHETYALVTGYGGSGRVVVRSRDAGLSWQSVATASAGVNLRAFDIGPRCGGTFNFGDCWFREPCYVNL